MNYNLTGWAEGVLGRGGDLFVVTEHKLVTESELESVLTISLGCSFLTLWPHLFYLLDIPLSEAISKLRRRRLD